MSAVLLSVSLQSRSDRQELLATLLLPDKVTQTLVQLPRPAEEGRGEEGCWAGRATDWHCKEPIGSGRCLLLPGAGANPSLPVSAFNNNSPSSNKEHLLRPATSHTKLPKQSHLNYTNNLLCPAISYVNYFLIWSIYTKLSMIKSTTANSIGL